MNKKLNSLGNIMFIMASIIGSIIFIALASMLAEIGTPNMLTLIRIITAILAIFCGIKLWRTGETNTIYNRL